MILRLRIKPCNTIFTPLPFKRITKISIDKRNRFRAGRWNYLCGAPITDCILCDKRYPCDCGRVRQSLHILLDIDVSARIDAYFVRCNFFKLNGIGIYPYRKLSGCKIRCPTVNPVTLDIEHIGSRVCFIKRNDRLERLCHQVVVIIKVVISDKHK